MLFKIHCDLALAKIDPFFVHFRYRDLNHDCAAQNSRRGGLAIVKPVPYFSKRIARGHWLRLLVDLVVIFAIGNSSFECECRPVRRIAPTGLADVNDSFVLRVYGPVDSAQSQSRSRRQRDLI